MAYIYETHLHTSVASACGRAKGSEYIPFYKERGYDGIFVTDHFYNGNTCVDKSLPWKEWVKGYCNAYHEAKEAGDKEGLKVFFGWEITYEGDDFIIYGLDEQWLLDHEDVIRWNQTEQYEEIKKAGGLVVQAHPFRERNYMNTIHLHPLQCDAWEVMNAGNEPYQNILAYNYAVDHNLTMVAGSDIHKVGSASDSYPDETFGIETEEPLNSEQDYVKLILSGKGFKMHVPEDHFVVGPHDILLPIKMHAYDNSIIPLDEKDVHF